MADISELILEVKNANNAVHEIDKVDKKLKQTTKSANELKTIGKTLFVGWSFSKLIGAAKAFGDAWRDTLITTRKFDAVFGSFNKNAQVGVKELTEKFHETERRAKDLIATIGSRLDFGFDPRTLGKVSADLARISEELASFYGKNVTDVSLKLTQALAGQTKGLKEYGINIDINGQKFKELTKSIQESTNETEEGAKALAVYSSILGKVKGKEGAFETQAKTLSQLLENIKNSFVDGPLAQAGQILSTIFGPILSILNQILNLPLVKNILSLTMSLGTVIGLLFTAKKILQGIQLLLPMISASIKKNLITKSIGPIVKFISIFVSNFKTTFSLLAEGLKNIFISQLVPSTRSFLTFLKGFGQVIASYTYGIFKDLYTIITKGGAKLLIISGTMFTNLIQSFLISMIKFGEILKMNWKNILMNTLAVGVISIIAIGTDMILSKTSSTYEKVKMRVAEYLQSLWNLFVYGKSGSDKEIQKEQAQKWKDYVNKSISNVEEIVKKVDEVSEELNKEILKSKPAPTKNELTDLSYRLRESIKTLANTRPLEEAAKLEYEKAKERFEGYKDSIAEQAGQQKDLEDVSLYESNEYKKYLEAEKKYLEILNERLKDENATKELFEKFKEAQESITKKADFKFGNFTWYKDLIDKIDNSLSTADPSQKIKSIQERIDKFSETYSRILLSPEEQKAKYKELANLEMQKFEAEMEALNKEKSFIQETNEMIKNYVDQALQWKAQGVEGIQAGTAEGYKFMTSGFSNLANLGPVLKDQEKSQKSLQEKGNSIAEDTKKVIEKINEKIQKINQNSIGAPLQLSIVNYK